jgi:type I restriction enzyme, S subunit
VTRLPPGWTEVQLSELGSWKGGGTPSKRNPKYWTNGTIPWVSPKDMKVDVITYAEDQITEAAVSGSATSVVPSGSVLAVTRSGILRRTFPVAVSGVPVAINQDLKALIPFPGINPRYVAWSLRRDEWSILHECTKDGTTVDSIDFPLLLARAMPLAPTAEQGRIVEAIDEEFSLLDAGVAAVARASQNVKRVRAAVLEAAVTGKLVAQDADDEPAAVWLESAGKEGLSADRRGLPAGWARTTIGALKTWSLYGPRFTSDDYASSGIPVLRTTDITTEGRILVDQAPKLALSDADLAKYRVRQGDILITRTGSIGTVAFVADDTPAIPGAYLILYRFGLPIEFTEFLLALLQTPRIRGQLIGKSAGVGRPNLNAKSIDATVVDVPPFAELLRILDEMKRALSAIEALETAIDKVRLRGHHIRASVLAAAFSGRLVRQNENDEPASVLLKRISAERGDGVDGRAPRRSGRRRKAPA